MADPLRFRLGDLKPDETLVVRCSECGRVTRFQYGVLQRRLKIPSDILFFDLQFRLKCSRCSSRGPFRIGVEYGPLGPNRLEQVIVPGQQAPLRILPGGTSRVGSSKWH